MKQTLILATAIAAALPAVASAHATLTVGEAKAESYFLATLQVPHGCAGKATTEVEIKLPEGFVFAKPQMKPGWDIELVKGKYSKTYDNHGKPVSEGVVAVKWKNGNLPDDFYDTFSINGKISGIAAGTAVPFVATQYCGSDATQAWDQVPEAGQDPHSLERPAPMLMVTAGEAHDHAGHHAGHMAEDAEGTFKPVMLGDLELTDGYIKAMTKGQPVGGGFITVTNKGSSDDQLVSVEAEGAALDHVELHEMSMDNNVMKMRMLKDGIAIPAGETVVLKPGGLHMMFMGVKEPFAEGQSVKAKLTFSKAGSVEITLPVKDARGGHQHN